MLINEKKYQGLTSMGTGGAVGKDHSHTDVLFRASLTWSVNAFCLFVFKATIFTIFIFFRNY